MTFRELRSIGPRRPISTAAAKRPKWLKFIKNGILSCFRSTQTHGYRFTVMPHRPIYETIFWTLTLITISSLTLWMILHVYIPVLCKPTVTTEQPFKRTVHSVPFPTIALCTTNRISREALINYSDFIFTEQKKYSVDLGKTREEVYEKLRPLGLVYQTLLETDDLYQMDEIHVALLKIYNGTYPLRDIMDDLAPKCSDLIRHCVWRGSVVNCSHYFQQRHSFVGLCCYFNYQRPLKMHVLAFKREKVPLKIAEPLSITQSGYEYGLSVVVNQRVDDYSHTVQDLIGTNVYMLDSTIYLDEFSGSVVSRLMQPNEELYISLDAFVVSGSDDMRPYEPHLRPCFFSDETGLDKLYTRSECILDCRMKDAIETCGCLPVPFAEMYDAPDCLLDDSNCLSRWILAWIQIRAQGENRKKDSSEFVEPKCPHCLRKCSYMKYIPSTSKADFDPTNHSIMSDPDSFLNRNDMSGHSILHINYKQHRLPEFEHTVAYMWFDLFGMFGGLCGLTFGGSIISVIELIYFGTGRFGAQFTRKISCMPWTWRSNESNNNNQSVSPTMAISPAMRPPAVSIYFNELVQYRNKRVENRMPLRRSQPKKLIRSFN